MMDLIPHDEIIVFRCGTGWGACYRDEEFNGPNFGFDPVCPLLAEAELVLNPWKEWLP